MDISNFIKKDDLGKPYVRLVKFLELNDIIKLENGFGGRRIDFKKVIAQDETYNTIASLIGKDKALKVMEKFSGLKVYFPTLKKACADKIRNLIISEFDGENYIELAKKYGYSERHTRRIIHDAACKKLSTD